MKNFFSRLYIDFSSECSSRTKIGRDLEFIRGERQFYLDHHGVVSFCTNGAGKQAVDRIM